MTEDMKLQHTYRGNTPSRFSTNSEAFASELVEYLEEMFPCINSLINISQCLTMKLNTQFLLNLIPSMFQPNIYL